MSLMGRTLIRHHVGALPLIHRIAARMGLRALLDAAIQPHGNDQVPVVDTLMLLIYNLTLGKEPLYELPEWVGSIDRRVIGYSTDHPALPGHRGKQRLVFNLSLEKFGKRRVTDPRNVS